MIGRRTAVARFTIIAAFALPLVVLLPACQEDSSFEEAGEEIDEGLEEIEDEVDDATSG